MLRNIFMPSIPFVLLYLPAQMGEFFLMEVFPPRDFPRRSKVSFVVELFLFLFPASSSLLSILFFC